MAKFTILPPSYHKAFAPTIVQIMGETKSEETATIYLATKNQSHTIIVELLHRNEDGIHYADIDIQAYVCSFFEYSEQEVSYVIEGDYEKHNRVALRSAAQVGEATSMEPLCGNILTDFDTLYGYSGYPLSASVLGREGEYYSFYNPQYSYLNRFTPLANGLTDYPLIPSFADKNGHPLPAPTYDCVGGSIWVRPSTDNVRWGDYRCQQYYIIDYTVTVKLANEELGVAWGGGLIEKGSSTPIGAKPLLENDIVFDAWYYNGTRREDLARELDFYPTEDCELVAHFTLNPKTVVKWSGYQCQEVEE